YNDRSALLALSGGHTPSCCRFRSSLESRPSCHRFREAASREDVHTMLMKKLVPSLTLILALATVMPAQQPSRHPLKLDDIFLAREVRDAQLSPDGQWVAYVVSSVDVKEDKSNTHIWMASYDGKSDRQITFSQESEASPRFSPDGKYLAFTSSRPGKAKGNQV